MNTFSFTYNNNYFSIRSNGNNTMTVTINDQSNTFKIVKGDYDIFTIEKSCVRCRSSRSIKRYFKRCIDSNIGVGACCVKPLIQMLYVKPVSNLK